MNLRERGRSGGGLSGTFVAIPHPVAVEVMAMAGFDLLCLDAEHAQVGRHELEGLARAAEVGGTPLVVRVAGNVAEDIAAALDAGAAGILVPRVASAEEARAAVAATRYPPEGARGAGPGRASRYGADVAGTVATANGRILLAVQVESAAAVAAAPEIAAVAGVDVVFVGPGDLAVSMGATGDPARVEAAILAVIAACRSAGVAVGLWRPSADDVARWRDAGVSVFVVASDTMILRAGAVRLAAALKPVPRAPKGRVRRTS